NRNQPMDCSSLPGLKRTALPGGMLTSAPVRGLRPIPVLRGRTLNTPKPRSSMRSPCESAFFMLSNTVSTACSALLLVMPVLPTTSLMMSSLITQPNSVTAVWDERRVLAVEQLYQESQRSPAVGSARPEQSARRSQDVNT